VLAGPSAARALEIPVDDPTTYLLLGPHANTRIAGVRVLYAAVAPADVGAVAGVPCTRRERTIFDCLRILDRPRAAALLDLALRRGWTTPTALAERIGRSAGRRGTPRMIGLLREWEKLHVDSD
jgi:hypothetical protein